MRSLSLSSTLIQFRLVSLLILPPLFMFFMHQQEIFTDFMVTEELIVRAISKSQTSDDLPFEVDDFETSVHNMLPTTNPLWKSYLQSKLNKRLHKQQPTVSTTSNDSSTTSITIVVTADVHGQVLHRPCQEPDSNSNDDDDDDREEDKVKKKALRNRLKMPQSQKGKPNKSEGDEPTSCVFPGAPYVSYVAKTIRAHEQQAQTQTSGEDSSSSSSVLLLDVGDAAFGSGQFDGGSIEESQLVAATMNKLEYDAMALGNHELDLGRPKLQAFVDQVQFPVLAANIDWGNEDSGKADSDGRKDEQAKEKQKGFVPQVRIPVGIGGNDMLCLFGLTANEPNPLAGPNVEIKPELETWRTKLQPELLSSSCTRTIILSHGGIDVDRQLEQELSVFNQQHAPKHQVDVILGGHSHVLLPSQLPDEDAPESPVFGTIQTDYHRPATDAHAPHLLHVGANGRYVGLLKLTWNSNTKQMTELQSGVLPLDRRHGVQPDVAFYEWQMEWMKRHKSETDGRKRIKTSIFLPPNVTRLCGQPCRAGECMLGEIISDSMRYCMEHQDECAATQTDPTGASPPPPLLNSVPSFHNDTRVIALLESGTLRNCLEIAKPDFYKIIPWPNKMVLLQLKGSLIREFLEHGIASKTGGGWLQTSGLHYKTHVTNKLSKPTLRQDESLWLEDDMPMVRPRYSAPIAAQEGKLRGPPVVDQKLSNPQLPLQDEELYWVVVTDWLASGGDGYASLVEKASQKIHTNITLYEAISFAYPKKLSAHKVAARGAVSDFLGGFAAFFVSFPVYTFFVRKSQNRPLVCGWSIFNGVWLGALATAISDALYFMMYESSFLFNVSPLVGSILAATINSLATSPLWVIVTQQQLLTLQMSIWNVMKSVYKTKGMWGFFDTLPFNLLLCSYPVIRQMALRLMEKVLGLEGSVQIAIAASLASIVATAATFPIQKWRVHLQSGSHENVWQHLSFCFFFRGLEFKIVDTIIKNFVLFFVKKQSDDVLNLILDG